MDSHVFYCILLHVHVVFSCIVVYFHVFPFIIMHSYAFSCYFMCSHVNSYHSQAFICIILHPHDSNTFSCIFVYSHGFSNSLMHYHAFPHLLMHCHADLCIPCILMFFHTFTHPHSFMHSHARVLSLFVRVGVCKTLENAAFWKFSSNKQGVRSQRARGQSRKHACWCDRRSKLEWVCFSTVPRVSVGLAWVSWCWCDRGSSPSTDL